MIFLCGTVLAAGILLMLSPWLWPAGSGIAVPRRDGRGRRLLDAAGYAHVATGRLAVAVGAGAVAAVAIAVLLVPIPVVLMLAAIVGAWAPIGALRVHARRRLRRRRALWPDVCDLMVAAVRSGASLPDAVGQLAEVGPVPLRPAFASFRSDIAASGHFDSAILRTKAVLGDPVADRILETLRMARQVGGTELTAVLRALATSVRAESALRGEVEARQSWVRGAAVLGVVAPWIVLVLLASRPEGAAAYSTVDGMVLIGAGAVVSVVAYRLMLRLGRLPEPQRWFG